ncbi:unnamed protein product [Prorocentrum cordatum]|uniref:Uncharacterized protein n=1 Tax=Prorocentrum cordatum TaxID=2364126 RepID=A0ABN9Q9Y1_9DINO|nr:unnamed protein product [Polarella glacialis]CAK0911471.1 unnamed protein product [Polarella glacialis]
MPRRHSCRPCSAFCVGSEVLASSSAGASAAGRGQAAEAMAGVGFPVHEVEEGHPVVQASSLDCRAKSTCFWKTSSWGRCQVPFRASCVEAGCRLSIHEQWFDRISPFQSKLPRDFRHSFSPSQFNVAFTELRRGYRDPTRTFPKRRCLLKRARKSKRMNCSLCSARCSLCYCQKSPRCSSIKVIHEEARVNQGQASAATVTMRYAAKEVDDFCIQPVDGLVIFYEQYDVAYRSDIFCDAIDESNRSLAFLSDYTPEQGLQGGRAGQVR